MNPVTLTLVTREEQEQEELRTLAPYATFAKNSKGRLHPENEHTHRTCFQRDRDRIIHSETFRRLVSKTQVFFYDTSDHYRTRLTHTLEVSQIARTLARLLRLNQDLCEVHALAHDLGHPPYGHAGERVLNQLMADTGGFEHNAQALRIVDSLESRYPNFPGLNLTAEARRSILKHKPPYNNLQPELDSPLTLEAQLVDIADEISYCSHDLDDGIASKLLKPEHIDEIPLWREAKVAVEEQLPHVDEKRKHHQIIIQIINMQVLDVAEETLNRLNNSQLIPQDQSVGYTSSMKTKVDEAKRFLFQNLYRHPLLLRINTRCSNILPTLFHYYTKHPQLLPVSYQERIDRDGLERIVCDYISGMTDRYAEQDFQELFGF